MKKSIWMGLVVVLCLSSTSWALEEVVLPGNYDYMCLGPEGKICKLDPESMELVVGDEKFKVKDSNMSSIAYDGNNWWYVTFYHVLKRGTIIDGVLSPNGPAITLLPDLEALEIKIYGAKIYILGTSVLRVFDLNGTEIETERIDLSKLGGLHIGRRLNEDWGKCLAVDNTRILVLTKFGKLIIYDCNRMKGKPKIFRLIKMMQSGNLPITMEVADNHLAVGIAFASPGVVIFNLNDQVKSEDSQLLYNVWRFSTGWEPNGIVWQNGCFRTMLSNFETNQHKIVDYPIVE